MVMSPDAHDDQALRLFRAAHADFSFRAQVSRRCDAGFDALVASVIKDTSYLAATASAPKLRLHHTGDRRLALGIRAA